MVQCKLLRFTYNSVHYGNQRSDRRAIEISGNAHVEIEHYSVVPVPCRNRTLFRCIFQPHYCI